MAARSAPTSEGEGKGATFTVMLPISPVYQVDTTGSRVHPGARDLLPPADSTDRLDGLRILVVDDEADTRDLLKQGLEYCGARVTVAESAAEAIDLMKMSVPDVLISDIGMPGTDGYDFIRQVRKLSRSKAAESQRSHSRPTRVSKIVCRLFAPVRHACSQAR